MRSRRVEARLAPVVGRAKSRWVGTVVAGAMAVLLVCAASASADKLILCGNEGPPCQTSDLPNGGAVPFVNAGQLAGAVCLTAGGQTTVPLQDGEIAVCENFTDGESIPNPAIHLLKVSTGGHTVSLDAIYWLNAITGPGADCDNAYLLGVQADGTVIRIGGRRDPPGCGPLP